jgi:CMP-N-acetylneuraminic acid synthetase
MSFGIDVPFLRPKRLSDDTSPTLPVVLHAIEMLEREGDRYDAVCLLQPTNPLRRAADIDNCIRLLTSSDADSVISVLPVPAEHNPYWVYLKTADGSLRLAMGDTQPISRRQDLPPAFHRDGSVYVTRTDVVTMHQSLYGKYVLGYEMSPEFSSNIDTLDDWREIEERMLAKVKSDEDPGILSVASVQ